MKWNSRKFADHFSFYVLFTKTSEEKSAPKWSKHATTSSFMFRPLKALGCGSHYKIPKLPSFGVLCSCGQDYSTFLEVVSRLLIANCHLPGFGHFLHCFLSRGARICQRPLPRLQVTFLPNLSLWSHWQDWNNEWSWPATFQNWSNVQAQKNGLGSFLVLHKNVESS